MKRCKNSKKGFSVIEIMCTLLVVSLAVVFGLQLYFVGAKATRNSAVLDDANEATVHYFETGDHAKLDAYDTVKTESAAVGFALEFGGGAAIRVDDQTVVTKIVEQGDIKTKLSVLQGSIGNNAG